MNALRLMNFALSSALLAALQFQTPGGDIPNEIYWLSRIIQFSDPSMAPQEVAVLEQKIAQLPSPAQRGDFYIQEAEAMGGMKPTIATPIILRLVREALECASDADVETRAYAVEGDALLALEYARIDRTVKSDSLQAVAVARQEKFDPQARARIAAAYLQAIALLADGIVDDTAQSGKMELVDIPPSHGNQANTAHKAAIRHNALVFRYRTLAGKLATLYTASDAGKKELATLANAHLKTPGFITRLLDYVGANHPKMWLGPDPYVPADGNFWDFSKW